jgi:hypothetical protein
LEDDLNKIPSIFCIFTQIDDILRCIEKEFGLTTNYAKGHGSVFENWMQMYHPTAYIYPIVQAGGSRQDLEVEGAPTVLMMPYYLHFLRHCLSIGISSDQKIFMLLQSTEVVALLWVLSILHIAVCLPTRWLAGTAMDLGL